MVTASVSPTIYHSQLSYTAYPEQKINKKIIKINIKKYPGEF